MKTSLLLLGSILLLACAGTARAGDASAQAHVLASASTTGNSVWATLGALFTGGTDNCPGGAMSATATDDGDRGGSDGLDGLSGNPDTRAHGIPAISDGGPARAAPESSGGGSSGKRSNFGWQSLLPGSIQ